MTAIKPLFFTVHVKLSLAERVKLLLGKNLTVEVSTLLDEKTLAPKSVSYSTSLLGKHGPPVTRDIGKGFVGDQATV